MQEYIQTDQLLHSLSQFIAKMNRQFVAKKDDDSHTNFYFDPLQGALISQWLPSQTGPLLFRLNLVDWSYEFLDNNFKQLHCIDLQFIKLSDLEDYILYGMEVLALNKDGFKKPLHFEIPNYQHAEDILKKTHPFHLEEWMAYRSLANTTCNQILGSFQSKAEVRIWPHHFDTAIYFKLNSKVYLGFGLAMQDDLSKQPYFYASAYNTEAKAITVNPQKNTLAAGEWLDTENFQAAILSLKEIKSGEEGLIHSYLRSVLKIYLSLP